MYINWNSKLITNTKNSGVKVVMHLDPMFGGKMFHYVITSP